MKTPVASDARALIRLAVRMGIPPEDAVRRVLTRMTDQQRPLYVAFADRSIRRVNP
jgi:hypothetical protein